MIFRLFLLRFFKFLVDLSRLLVPVLYWGFNGALTFLGAFVVLVVLILLF